MGALRGQIWNKKDLLVTLTAKQHNFVSEDTKVYLRDVLDHCISMEQRLEMAKDILNNTHSTFLARVSLGKICILL